MIKQMNVIDISSYQAEMDLDTVFAQNPLGGCIVKSTEGVSYVNPYCDGAVQWLISHDKPWGFYHYMNADDPISEAKWFYSQTSNYFRCGIPVADFEGQVVSKYGTFYLRKFLDELYSLSGIRPMVYCSLSVIQADPEGFRPIAEAGNKLWVAQYADMNDKWLGTPVWQNGSVAPFKEITMHQYSGTGRINGYPGRVDLSIFYGDATDWRDIAEGKDLPDGVDSEPKAPDPIVVSDVLHNKYGVKEDRVMRLTNEGYDAEAIQRKIDELYVIAAKCKEIVGDNMAYLNCIDYIMRSMN